MNLRCIYCQTPFTLSRTEMLGAIINMNEKNQNHYDAHCPRCRRANSISRQRMELFFPNWRDAAKQHASQPAAPAAPPRQEAYARECKNAFSPRLGVNPCFQPTEGLEIDLGQNRLSPQAGKVHRHSR